MDSEGVAFTVAGWTKIAILVLATAALLSFGPAAPAQAADPVVNPGSNFAATVTGGTLKVGSLDPIDVSEMNPAPRLRNVTVDAAGNLSAAKEDFVFPQLVYTLNAPVVGAVDAYIQLRAEQPVTGTIDPTTGEVTLDTALSIQITASILGNSLGNNCYVGTPASPIAFHGVAGSAKGVPYEENTGELTVVEDTLAVPAATGCNAILGQNVTQLINDQLDLPSPSGSNELTLEMRFKPGPHSENWVDPDGPAHIEPVIVNDTPVEAGGQTYRSWLESFTINGNDSRKFMTARKGNTLRVSLLVEHDPGRQVTGLRIDDDWNATDDSDGAAIKPVTPVQPVVSGGFNYSRVTFEYQAPIAGMGVTCPEVVGGTMNRIADLSIRAVLDNGDETASSSSKIALSRDDCDVAREDAPMVYDWQAQDPGTEVTPGTPLTVRFRLDDTDEALWLWTRAGGYNWRWRNLDTGATTLPTKFCHSDAQNGAMQTINTTAPPSRGRWVMEAELLNLDWIGPGCTHKQLPNYWFWLGAVDVNSPQDHGGTKSPKIGLTVPGRLPNVNGHYRPGASGDLAIVAGVEDTLDLAAGGQVQAIEWDLDGDAGNGVDGFEMVRLGNSRTGMAPGQEQVLIETAGNEDTGTPAQAPGIYPVRARAGDNGALGAADSIRRTTVSDTLTYMVNTPPTAQDLAVTTDYGKPAATALVASDTNADGSHDPLTWSLVTPPAHGYLAGEWPNRVYHPEDGFSGSDSFTFKVDDGFGGTDTATVTVTVKPKPVDPPDPDPGPKLNHLEASFVEGRMNLNEAAGPSTSGVPVVDSTVPDPPVTFTTDRWNRATGAIDAPASDLKFPSKSVQMSITDPLPLDLDVKIEFGAVSRITGSYDQTSGEMKLNFNAHALITVSATGLGSVLTCDVTPIPLAFSSRGADLVDPGETGKRPAKNWKAADFKPAAREGAVTSLWNSLPASTAISEPLAPTATCAGTLDALIGGKGGFWLGGKVKVDGSGGDTNPPNGSTAIFDGKRLHLRLKCGRQYKPACRSVAVPVTKKAKVKKVRKKGKVRRIVKRGKPMAKPVRKKIKAGKWVKVSFLIKPKYRAKVQAMSKKNAKTLFVQQKIKSKKIGKKKFRGKKPRTVYHRYRVRTAG